MTENFQTCVSSGDSDQPAHPRSLISLSWPPEAIESGEDSDFPDEQQIELSLQCIHVPDDKVSQTRGGCFIGSNVTEEVHCHGI